MTEPFKDSEPIRKLEDYQKALENLLHVTLARKDDPLYERRTILFAFAKRFEQQIRTVLWLAQEDIVEEMIAFARIMLEVTINAMYLQFANDRELANFKHFEMQKTTAFHLSLCKPDWDSSKIALLQSELAKLRALTGKRDTDLTWSSKSLSKRALLVEEHYKSAFSADLHKLVSGVSNSAIHGTFGSLFAFAPRESISPIGSVRRDQKSNALTISSIIAQCFLAFIVTVAKDNVAAMQAKNASLTV